MQKQTLKCVDARHLIHLAVGDDALSDEEQQLANHLHLCSDCRAYHAGMMDAMYALERVRDADYVEPVTNSIWPDVAAKLKSRQAASLVPEPRRFNVAVATLCACSLMLALVTAVQHLPSNQVDQLSGHQMMPAMNVAFQQGQFQLPAHQPGRLVPMRQQDGSVILVDQATGQTYVPGFAAVEDDELNF